MTLSWLVYSLLVALASPLPVPEDADWRFPEFEKGVRAQFVTRPDIETSIWNISIRNDTQGLAPGYFWITPYNGDWESGSYGPSIFTMDGELVWNGNEGVEVRAMDGQACDYLGQKKKHICYNDAAPIEQMGHSAGVIRFFDNSYTQVGWDYARTSWMRDPDIHELNSVDDGYSLIQDVFQKRLTNLSEYLGPEKGYIADGCFQEVDIKSMQTKFEWCASDYIDLWETYIYLAGTNSKNYTHGLSGTGRWLEPWDYFHINAIDKNVEGDYIVSARHLDTIFKVAGKYTRSGMKPGSIIWRLGGKKNDFTMMDTLHFGRQHHARFISTSYTEEVISLFDNADDGQPPSVTAPHSAGKFIRVNNNTMEAYLDRAYVDPEGERSPNQGSVQLLDNGHVVVGWGNRPLLTEFAKDGTVLWHGRFSAAPNSFRSWKYPWVGNPKTKPTIITYAQYCDAPMYGYISWNGATEVRSYRWYVSWASKRGPWHYAGTFRKDGFETFTNFSKSAPGVLTSFAPFVFAQALDKDDQVLSTTDIYKTYVPNADVTDTCNDTHCPDRPGFKYDQDSDWQVCYSTTQNNMVGTVLALLFVAVWELFTWYMHRFGWEALVMGLDNNADTNPGAFQPLNGQLQVSKMPKQLHSGPDSPTRWDNGKEGTEFPMFASGVEAPTHHRHVSSGV